ncbi:MAG: hypothetical protein U1D55_02190 [Phycisphaerae bacterium]
MVILLLAGAAQGDDEVLKPSATFPVPAGVEWIEGVTVGRMPLLVVCDRRGGVSVFSLLDEWKILRPALALRPGTRMASHASDADRVYLFDDYEVRALQVVRPGKISMRAELRWQIGQWPADLAESQQDPEFLPRIVAAQTVDCGVLLARSDGKIALLSERDGATLWTADVGRFSDCEWRACGDQAALFFRAGAAYHAVRFDIDPRGVILQRVELGKTQPLHMALSEFGVVAVWPDCVESIDRAGTRRRVVEISPRWPPPGFAIDQRNCDRRAFISDAGGIRCVDLMTCNTLWEDRTFAGTPFRLTADDWLIALRWDRAAVLTTEGGVCADVSARSPNESIVCVAPCGIVATLHRGPCGAFICVSAPNRRWYLTPPEEIARPSSPVDHAYRLLLSGELLGHVNVDGFLAVIDDIGVRVFGDCN